VAHALVNTDQPLGIVPAGTGNLVARELGIPLDTRAAVALVAGPHRLRRVDAMGINGRTYLLNAGVGVNAAVVDRTSRLGKSLFGRGAYVGTAVWRVLRSRPQRLDIAIDGVEQSYDATDVLISNCGALARGLHPNGPDIRMDDGQIDVGIVCMKVPLEYPWFYCLRHLVPRRVNRIIHEHPARCTVTIRSAEPIAVQADGDIIGTTPVEIAVYPQALNLIEDASRRD
jgi:diacylglycerol kinase family enzyme